MPCSFWPRQVGSSSRTSCSAVPSPSTLPWPKIAKTPGNSGTSVPSSSSERCAIIQRTSACAVVSRIVPVISVPPVPSGSSYDGTRPSVRPGAEVTGHRGSISMPDQVSRIQAWAGSSQNAIARSSPGPAITFR